MKARLTRRILAVLLAAAMILAVLPSAFASAFTDVEDGKWYAAPIEYCVSNEIMSGVGEGKFDPTGTVTREQGVQALYALDGSNAVPFETLFSDVEDGKWFAPAVIWGAKNEIVAGIGDGKFGVGINVTREQMASFFFRYAKYAGADVSAEDDLASFPDNKDTSSWAVESVKWAVGVGIISGKAQLDGPTLLAPKDELTRAELAVMMMKFHQFVNAKELEGKTVILHSNDVHGAIDGYKYITALKADFEAKGAEVILADAGDYSQGSTYVSLSKGANAVTMMNEAGYDVATLGNHEFDYGYAQLAENLEKANFKVVCADILKDGAAIYDPYTIIEKGGVKIAFIGLDTPEAQTKVNPALIKGLDFLADTAIWEEAQKQVDAAKAEGADLIVGLVHLGVDDSSKPYTSYDLTENVTGLDFVIDGHSHTVMEEGANGEPIQSTGTAFANIGVIVIDNATKAIEDNYLYAIGEDAPVDEAVAAKAKELMDAVDAEYGEVFAKSEVELNGDKAPNGNRDSETNNGDMITDAMIWCVTEQYPGSITEVPAENIVAITNGGGIRAWIHEGDVTKNDVLSVLPFGNTVAVVYVTGAELLEALEASTYCTPEAVGGFPQVAGIEFTVETYKDYDANAETYPGSTYYGPATINRVTIDSINGQPFDPEAKYAVVTNNFCAAGGDTYYAFAAATSQFDTGYTLDAVVMDYITEKLDGVIPADLYAEPQGRISIVTAPPIDGEIFVPSTKRDGVDIPTYVTLPEDYDPEKTYDLVMLIHGHGGNHNEWGGFDPITNGLAEKGIIAVTQDFSGCGDSKESFRLNTMTNMKNDVLDVLAYMEENYNIGSVGAMGYSMGGRIALELTAEELYSFDKLEFVAPAEDYEDLKNLFGGHDNWDLLEAEANEKGFVEYTTIYATQELSKEWFADLAKYPDGLAEAANEKFDGESFTIYALDDQAVAPSVSQGVADIFGSPVINTRSGGHGYSFYVNDEANHPLICKQVNRNTIAFFTGGVLKDYYEDAFYSTVIPDGADMLKYGHIDIAIPADEFLESYAYGDRVTVELDGYGSFTVPVCASYDDVAAGEMLLRVVPGKSYLILAINYGQLAVQQGIVEKAPEGSATAYVIKDGVTFPINVTIAPEKTSFESIVIPDGADMLKYGHIDIDIPADEFLEVFSLGDTVTVTLEGYGSFDVPVCASYDDVAAGEMLLRVVSGKSYLILAINYGQLAVQQGIVEKAPDGAATAYVVKDGVTFPINVTIEKKVTKVESVVIPDGADMLKYGHIDIDYPADEFLKEFEIGDIVTVDIDGYGTYEVPVCASYDDVSAGEPLLRVVSGKTYLILAINYGQIAVQEGLVEKAPDGAATAYVVKDGVTFPIGVTITLKSKGDPNILGNLIRTDVRTDYPELSDAEFANFRKVTTTGILDGILYRSSSPINPEIGRNLYADAAAAEAGVKTFINLADTEAEATGYPDYAGSYYSEQNHIFLGLPVAFTTDTFKNGLANGFRYIIDNEGPYLVHCTEGKDRAGLTAAILECLMGASYDEVIDDYVQTYRNYYSVENGAQRALTAKEEEAAAKVILANLKLSFGVEITETTDLAAAAEDYMKSIGLSDSEIAALKARLGGETPSGEYVAIVLNNGNKAVSTTPSYYEAKGYWQLVGVDVEIIGGKVPYAPEIAFEMVDAGDDYYMFISGGKYLTSGETGNNLTMEDTASDLACWKFVEADGGYYLQNKAAQYSGNPQFLEYYTTFTVYGMSATAKPENYTFTIYPLSDVCTEHDFVAGTPVAATCTEAGYTPYTCSKCGATEKHDVIAALGHDFVEGENVAASCTKAGYTLYECSRCDATEKRDEVAALGHIDEDEDGECDVCGTILDTVSKFVKITSADDLKDGTYLIVYETDSIAMNGGLAKVDAAHNNISVTITDGVIAADEATMAASFEILAMDGGYSIQAAGGSYISGSSSKNTIVEGTSAVANTITFDENGNAVIFAGGYLLFNKTSGDNNYRFRYYKAQTQQPIQLYKLVSG